MKIVESSRISDMLAEIDMQTITVGDFSLHTTHMFIEPVQTKIILDAADTALNNVQYWPNRAVDLGNVAVRVTPSRLAIRTEQPHYDMPIAAWTLGELCSMLVVEPPKTITEYIASLRSSYTHYTVQPVKTS